jgi:hypothetical protein
MSDEMLYRPETLPGPLVPYQCGLPCWHQMQIEAAPAGDPVPPPATTTDNTREVCAVSA